MLADTGLAETIGTGASENLGVTSLAAITVFSAVLAVLISETTSNTAAAAVIVPVVIPLCQAMEVDPLVPAMAATFAASFGFMLPVSTPQNAIVYGTGAVPMVRMIRTGAVFDVLGIILIVTMVPVMVGLVGLLTPWSMLMLPAGPAAFLTKAAYVIVAAALVVTVVTGLDYVREAMLLSRQNAGSGQ